MRRRFVVIVQSAAESPEFSLLDLPGTSGRLDVLLRCVRAALLVSHGLRRDTMVYLVLLGGPRAPRVLRIDGSAIRFVRPDERALALLVQKALARELPPAEAAEFVLIRPGIAIASGDLGAVIADLDPHCGRYILEEAAPDIRESTFETSDVVFFVGDHHGFDERTRAQMEAFGALPIGLGPVGLHAEDAITVTNYELDRR